MHPRPSRVAALLLALALSAVPAAAVAHAELVSSTPPDGAVLTAVPDEVVLTFSEEVDVDLSEFTVSVAGAVVGTGSVDLAVAERNVMRGPLAGDAVGAYSVSWVAVATDGHAEEGIITFTVGDIGDAAVADGRLAETLARAGMLVAAMGLLLGGTRLLRRRTLA